MKKLLMLFLAMLLICQATTTHAEEVKLTAGDKAADDNFSTSVSISGDYAIVGAPGNDDDGDRSGSAYIFVCSEGIWTEQAKLTTKDGEGGDFYGRSVAISGDTVIAGMPQDDDDAGRPDVGSAYVFARSGSSWKEQAKLTASDAAKVTTSEFPYPSPAAAETLPPSSEPIGTMRTEAIPAQPIPFYAAAHPGLRGQR